MPNAAPLDEPKTLEEARIIIAAHAQEIAELRAKLIALDAQFRRFIRRTLSRSEKLIHDPGQESIAEVAALAADLKAVPIPALLTALPAAATNVPTNRPARRPRGRGLRTLPDHLQIVEERIELVESERHDLDGTMLVPVGEERSFKLDYIQAYYLRRVFVRIRYGRRDTREPIRTAPMPPSIVERGLPTDRLVLSIAHQKYAYGMPLYRQRIEWLRHGIDLSVPTACSWLEHLSLRLANIVGAIRQQILAEPYLHLDDTPLKQLEPGRGRAREARVWCYRGGGQVYYDFSPTRGGRWCQAILQGYRGYVVADAYSGHDRLFLGNGAIEVGCWAHARRPFRDLMDRRPIAREILELIQGLYRIDEVADARAAAAGSDSTGERYALRRVRAPEILAAIRARCEAIQLDEPPSSDLAGGATYILNHWNALSRFLDQGYLPLDNNPAEQAMRTVATGRKNFMFVASEDGGHWAATNYTIFQSCRQLGIDPIAYLTQVMPTVIASKPYDPLALTPKAYLQQARRQAS